MTRGVLYRLVLALFVLSLVSPVVLAGDDAQRSPLDDRFVADDDKTPQKEKSDEDSDEDSDDESNDEGIKPKENQGSSARRWLERMVRLRPPSSNERNHPKVRSAFRKVVVEPNLSTTRVYADGKPAAYGAIVDASGFVLTKASELDGKLECRLHDGRRVAAELVGMHRENDLAMLKITADDLTPVRWAEDESPAVGSWLITPGAKQEPAAIGVVSAPARRIAAPRGVLGVMLDQTEGGPRVSRVLESSAAEKAGIKVDDVITHVNGKGVKTTPQLVSTIQKFQPGDRVRLTFKRGGSLQSLTATLGGIEVTGRGKRERFQNGLGGPKLSRRKAGFPSVLQHDTVLHPYQCGGPIVNLDGETIGINIAHAGRVASYALPASVVRPLLDDLMSGKLAPGPSPAELQLKWAERLEKLKVTVAKHTRQLADLSASLKKSAEVAADAAKKAESPDADADVKKLAEETQKAQAELKSAVEKAKAALDKAIGELKKVEGERVSLNIDE